MACFHPLQGYRARAPSAKGITFSLRDAWHDIPVQVPCGQCVGCRLERSRQWAIRCMHEASLYPDNCFLTLTYSDQFLPANGSLDKRAFPLFMKRLRKRFFPRRVRYYHAGEYGSIGGRPHYHACLFGFDFVDKTLWAVRHGFPVFRSKTLEVLWPFGLSELGCVTFESAAYVARYIMKKVTGNSAEDHYGGRVPEYTTMSRRPGIGRPWLDKYVCEVFPADSVVVRGKLMKPPRYYDLQYAAGSPELAELIASERRRRRKVSEETPERLAVREECANARLARIGERGL